MKDTITDAPDGARGTGIVLALTAVAIVVLFLAHPPEHATDFAGMVKEEAANQWMNGVVHGGFCAILGIQLACLAIFSGRLGWSRPLVIAALTFFAIGTVMRMIGIFADGVLTPALAAHYLTVTPDQLAAARSVFRFCSVMSYEFGLLGALFEAAGIAFWGAALFGASRIGGVLGVLIGVAMIAALAFAIASSPTLSMLAILGLLLWALLVGGLMIFRMV